jgi:hypothetical protein
MPLHGVARGSADSWLLRRDPRVEEAFAAPAQPEPERSWRLLRADDMLLLDVWLFGLVVDDGALRRKDAEAILVASFPPQAFAEEVFDDTSPNPDPSPLQPGDLPAALRHAGLSRVAVRMPAELQAIDFTSEALLEALAEWPLAIVPRGILGPWLDRLADELTVLANEATELLPEDHAETAVGLADRAARRASEAARGGTSGQDLGEAVRSLAAEVATAAQTIGLDDEQSAALLLRAELGFARRFIEIEGPLLGAGKVIDLLPGLLWLYVPREPARTLTAIELPYRLVQSPGSTAAFSHGLLPVTRNGLTELWHTRLGERVGALTVDATERQTALSAIWSPDYGRPETDDPPFETSLSARDRDEIVRLTSDETGFLPGTPRRRYSPQPARTRRLMLTALGGWLDLEGKWDKQPADARGLPLSLASWKHHAALGRDWLVETARAGRLLPFGHRAVYIQLTERRFQDEAGGPVGVLRRKRFVEVREPQRTYPDATQPFGGRDFPFGLVEIVTVRTPNLLPPTDQSSFCPTVDTPAGPQDFRFEVRATDIGGQLARFDVPMRFVWEATPAGPALDEYNDGDQQVAGRTTAPLHGQTVQLAPAASGVDASGAPDPGDVIYPVTELRFGASAPTVAPPPGSPAARFHPWLRTLQVASTALAHLTGDDRPGEFAYADVYRQSGFDPVANVAEIMLTATGALPMVVDFTTRSTEKSGGIVTPNFPVAGTSRALGAVGGDYNDLFPGGKFEPEQFFQGAKVLGGVDLADILESVPVNLGERSVPMLRTRRTDEALEVLLEYRRKKLPNGPQTLRLNFRGKSQLDLKSSLTQYFDTAKEPKSESEATLTWFKLNCFGCVIVTFDSFRFKASSSKGIEVVPDLADKDGVVFGGPLAFVDRLRRLLGGKGPVGPVLKLEPRGASIGLGLKVPTLNTGIFTLKNLMVSTLFTIRFDGQPANFDFGFAERTHPFQLTIGFLGGGGFVLIALDAERPVREIQAALEFGAMKEADFGVASGGIYIKAGIYIYFNEIDRESALKGFVEMGGALRVLGIITVSVTLHLSLGYYKTGTVSEVRGQATLLIEIELLFFSIGVNLTVEQRFGGSENDPTFAQLIPSPTVWDAYAEAFA